ncbi:hypothetical protein WJX84_006719 [Apatococcus fuscideae]|uniref:CASP C-terminal domain-containing protein n=1 Tax=Apatococcus fuscideae TaxID=2026836 RepID=A0AAW1SNF6_9CHLO
MKNLRLEGVLDGLGRNVKAAFEPEFPGQSSAQQEAKDIQNTIGFWRLFLMQDKKAVIQTQKKQAEARLARSHDEAGAAFVELANLVLAAPDPVPLMSKSQTLFTSLNAANVDIKKLQDEISHARSAAEASTETNAKAAQLDTMRQDFESQLAAGRDAARQLEIELQQAKGNAQQGQEALIELQSARSTLATLQEHHEAAQSELFELRQKQDSASMAAVSDLEADIDALTEARRKIRSLEQDRDRLQRLHQGATDELEALKGDATGNAHLYREALQMRDQEAATSASLQQKLQKLKEQCQGLQQQADAAEQELSQRPSSAAYQKAVDAAASLQSLVGQQMEAEGWGSPAELDTDQINTLQMLQERNLGLADKVTTLERQINEQQQKQETTAAQEARLEAQCNEQQALIGRLEEDLTSSSAARQLDGTHSTPSNEHIASKDTEAEPGSMLAILIGQRDRYRSKLQGLQEESARSVGLLQTHQAEIAALKADNVSLVGKLRYAENFAKRAGQQPSDLSIVRVDDAGVPREQDVETASHRINCGPFNFGMSASAASSSRKDSADTAGLKSRGGRRLGGCFGVDEDVEAGLPAEQSKYTKDYQAKLNPFSAFQQRECEAQLDRMQMHDRALLAGSRVFANRIGRIFILGYLLLIHAFLFGLIYFSALSSHFATGHV